MANILSWSDIHLEARGKLALQTAIVNVRAKLLLDKGTNTNSQGFEGQTPLQAAYEYGICYIINLQTGQNIWFINERETVQLATHNIVKLFLRMVPVSISEYAS